MVAYNLDLGVKSFALKGPRFTVLEPDLILFWGNGRGSNMVSCY